MLALGGKSIAAQTTNDYENLLPVGLSICTESAIVGPKIVGGSEIIEHSWWWLAQLRRYGSFICGSSILSDRWVLTAAHCCESASTGYSVVIGAHASNSEDHVYTIEQRIMHPNYGDSNGINNDFCLLKTAEPMDLSNNTNANIACLPNADEHATPNADNCYVAGWGALSSGGGSPAFAQSAGVTIYSEAECRNQSSYGSTQIEFDTEFCAGDINGGTDSCQGDSGGPLVCIVNNMPYLYGVVSWGIGCASRGYPGIYAKVSSAIEWIIENTNGDGNDYTTEEFSTTSTSSSSTTTATTTTASGDGTGESTIIYMITIIIQ